MHACSMTIEAVNSFSGNCAIFLLALSLSLSFLLANDCCIRRVYISSCWCCKLCMDYEREREKPASLLLCERYDTRCGLKKNVMLSMKKRETRKKSYFSLHRYASIMVESKSELPGQERERERNECEKACEVTIAM
jgi:hypothetical protein